VTPGITLVIIPGVQKFSAHTCSELPRVFVLARFGAAEHCECSQDSEQKHDWRNSVWHLVGISLTIDWGGFKNEYDDYFST
jgi:hypothetical protein